MAIPANQLKGIRNFCNCQKDFGYTAGLQVKINVLGKVQVITN